MHILFLSQWYPHRYDAMAGLFVRKHAQAVVRQGVDVTVLYLHHDEHIRKEELVEQITDGVREVYVYYPHTLGFLKAYRHGYRYIKRKWGRPDLCQLNVISKNGLLPLCLWKKFSIPYVIVEHWTGYTDEHAGSIQKGVHRLIMRYIAKQAQFILPVSQDLALSMQKHGFVNTHYQVIHNVVDDFFYTDQTQNIKRQTPNTKHFIHISCFDEKAKNIQGLLRAIHMLAQERQDFHVTLVGTGVDFAVNKAYAESLGLIPDRVSFTGELPPKQVAEELRQADAMLLFSNYENAPVVISEALAIGIPVFSTNVGGIAEMVNKDCGVLVEARQEKEMAQIMGQYMNGNLRFDAAIIRQYGKQYSFEAVGKELKSIYESAISRS